MKDYTIEIVEQMRIAAQMVEAALAAAQTEVDEKMTRFPDIDVIVGRYVQAQHTFITEMAALVRGIPSAPQRRANLRKRLLNLIRNSEISASMHPLTEMLMMLDEVGIDLDAIERDIERCEGCEGTEGLTTGPKDDNAI